LSPQASISVHSPPFGLLPRMLLETSVPCAMQPFMIGIGKLGEPWRKCHKLGNKTKGWSYRFSLIFERKSDIPPLTSPRTQFHIATLAPSPIFSLQAGVAIIRLCQSRIRMNIHGRAIARNRWQTSISLKRLKIGPSFIWVLCSVST